MSGTRGHTDFFDSTKFFFAVHEQDWLLLHSFRIYDKYQKLLFMS